MTSPSCSENVGIRRLQGGDVAQSFSISNLKIYIFSLEICIFSLKMYISNLEIDFYGR